MKTISFLTQAGCRGYNGS